MICNRLPRLRRTAPGIIARVTLAAVMGGQAGCTFLAPSGRPGETSQPRLAIVDPPRRQGSPLLFLAMPMGPAFQETRKGLIAEVAGSYDVKTFIVTPDTSLGDFSAALDAATPACVVLMNNKTARLYRDYQRKRTGRAFAPAVVVMTSFLEDIQRELERATGIAYEVPGVTAFVSFRALIKAPVTRVGVLHSPYAKAFVHRQRLLATKERIELISIELGGDAPTGRDIHGALYALKRYHQIDVLWVLNDNRLLRDARFLREAWLPAVRSLGVPVVVGAAPLVNPSSPFGTFAVLPDHSALGVQAANLIFDLAEDEWRIENHPVELPLSTVKVLDVPSAKPFRLRSGALNQVDRPLE